MWQLAMQHSPVGVSLISPEGEVLSANTALCDMLGYEPEQLASMTAQDLTHPDDADADLQLAMEVLAGNSDSFRVIKRYLRSDGSVMVGDLSVVLVRDDGGAPIHFISQVIDLSERRAFEARLESAERQIDVERRRAEAVFDTVTVGLLLLDEQGNHQLRNARHRELLGMAFPVGQDGQVGQLGFVYDAEQARRLATEEMPEVRAAAGEEFQDMLVWVGAQPATRRALSVSARSVRDGAGNFAGAAMACHDVTELMRAIQVKDDFLASVSHELRTPLTSALAYLELLEGAEHVEPAVRTQVAAVRRNAMRLSHLVADLLFTATATSGAQVIDPFRVDLAMVLHDAVEAARPDAGDGGVRLEADLPETLSVVVDGIRLRQVADNLIANAIRYTLPDGCVRVTLSTTDGQLEIVVADSGEGIDESDLADIFSTFVRGQNARRRLVPGTGLGLSIVRTIVEAHGGQVSLESAVGVGTTVRLVLPR